MGDRVALSMASEAPKFRFSYRIYIREEGWPKVRNAIELRVPLMDGEPATLDEIYDHLKDAALRAVENFIVESDATPSKESQKPVKEQS